jgi:hypothetical protein
MANFTVVLKTHNEVRIGELAPINLRFDQTLDEVGTINFDLPQAHPLCRRDRLQPYITDFYLYRDALLLMAGMITAVKMSNQDEIIEIAGKDWMHYLEIREYPFDPSNPLLFDFQKQNADVYQIIEDMLDVVLAEPNSLPLIYDNGLLGVTINYKIELADTEDILSKIKNLADQHPIGFDYEVTPDRHFIMHSPQKGSAIDYPLEKDNNVYTIDVTDNGPKGNHVLATGAGTSNKLAAVTDDDVSQAMFRRIDTSQDFGNIVDQSFLDGKTLEVQQYAGQPLFEFDIVILPQAAEDIYLSIQLGDTVPVRGDFRYMQIDSPHRVVSRKVKVNEQGDEEITLGVNDVPD